MLVLTRKQQETIVIGGNVTITVVRIQGNTVRVGIEAPTNVRILRGEVRTRDEAVAAGPTAVPLGDGEPLRERVTRRIASRDDSGELAERWPSPALAAI